MSARRRIALRPGTVHSVAAVVVGAAMVAIIIAASWSESQTAGRLALLGLAVFVVAVAIGSNYIVGLTTVPMLGAALLTAGRDGDPAWVRMTVLGILWYLATELAWHAIERRDGVHRTPALLDRRLEETTTVALLAVGASLLGALAASLAPVRTALVIGPMVVGVAAVLVAMQRILSSSVPTHRVIEHASTLDENAEAVAGLGDSGDRSHLQLE